MKKRIGIYGSTGMLGHMVYDHLRQLSGWEVLPITRTDLNFKQIEILNVVKPEVVINCEGIVKQAISDSNWGDVVKINTVLPSVLSSYCEYSGAKYVHFSTDCVVANDSPDMSSDGHLTPSGYLS